MTNANPSRSGLNQGNADDRELFLKVFSGEILKTFNQTNLTRDKHMVRTISSGKSAQFPVVGQVAAEYHTPGAEIAGNIIPHTERVVSIDAQLIAPIFIPEVDEAMNHYDVRQPYSSEAGIELATEWDQHVFQKVIQGARATANLAGGDGGTIDENPEFDDGTTAAGVALAGAIFGGAQALDEHNVAANDRYCFLRPAEYYTLAQTTDVINRDWGGNGSYSEGEVLKVAGININKSNNVPDADVANASAPTYDGLYNTTVGVIYHKSAVATVKLMDMSMRMDYDPRRLGWLVVAKFLMGTEFLRPESCVELRTATPV